MFESLLSERVRPGYRRSRHKARMDERAGSLIARGYKVRLVGRHLGEWVDFVELYEVPDATLPASVHDAGAVAYLRRRCRRRKDGQSHIEGVLRLLLDDDEAPRLRPGQELALYQQHVPGYLEFACQHRGVRAHRPIENGLRTFLAWLDARDVADLATLTIVNVRDYLDSLRHLGRSTLARSATVVRGFLRYLHLRGVLVTDLAAGVESPRLYKWSEPPRVIDVETIHRVLAAVDRSTAIGKRDYAMLLLAARYGLRPSDIRGLRLDDLRWRERRIALMQAKTQRQLDLPLVADVDEAIVDYLRHGRPKCAAREIFVRHLAPITRLSPHNNLWNVMARGFRAAGVNPPTHHRGLYLLRHSVATQMLARGVSIDVISDVLGHASVETTRVYAQVDLVGLRSVALTLAQVTR